MRNSTIDKGLYVWDGNRWLRLSDEGFSNGVYQFSDTRDGEVYVARSFGNIAGDWMLENLRYVPNPDDGYDNYTHYAGAASATDKQFAYPTQIGPYITTEQPKED